MFGSGISRRAALALAAIATSITAMAGMASAEPAPSTGSAAGTGGLNPLLAAAFTFAKADAQRAGVQLTMTSGYRSYAEQDQLWREALKTYGSAKEARRWVLPPSESAHVAGRAIDVGPEAGARWLQANGNRYGLCRLYLNEWWHFELATFPGGACPAMRADSSTR